MNLLEVDAINLGIDGQDVTRNGVAVQQPWARDGRPRTGLRAPEDAGAFPAVDVLVKLVSGQGEQPGLRLNRQDVDRREPLCA